MLKHVQVHTSIMETLRAFTSGNFALDSVTLARLAINTLRRCPKFAAQEVGFDTPCEIVDGTPRGIDTLITHMRGMVFTLIEHESKELFRQYCRPVDLCPDKMDRV